MYRKTFLEINVDKIKDNYNLFLSKTNKKIMAIVKANAYGLIDYKMAEYLSEMGCDFFGVSSIEEALRLRRHGIKEDILIMGYASDLNVVKENDFSIIIPSIDYVYKYKDCLDGVKTHIKINTGLNRLGILPSEAKEVLDVLLNSKAKVEGIMSHYACFADVDYSYSQYYLFKETVEKLNYDFKYIHASATDVALYLDDDICNYTRIGVGLFGYTNIDNDWDLKPSLSLKAEVIACKKVEKGDGVSYGHHYISDGSGYILTVAIGYADGLDRKLENRKVFINNEECTVIGSVCMDLITVKSDNPHDQGELVEIIGEHNNVIERRNEYETCTCKVLTDIKERVTRIYIKDNKVDDEINMTI